MSMCDISKNFRWNPADAFFAQEILKYEGTPEAIRYFAYHCHKLTNYGYWFFLSTLWVNYVGFSDLDQWKQLFASTRPGRLQSIMKPSELNHLQYLPWFVKAYRAPRDGETDWISYTLDLEVAKRFAAARKSTCIRVYRVKKADITALFLRRGEKEIIVLDKSKAAFLEEL